MALAILFIFYFLDRTLFPEIREKKSSSALVPISIVYMVDGDSNVRSYIRWEGDPPVLFIAFPQFPLLGRLGDR